MRWFTQARSRQLPMNGPLLKAKANQLAKEIGLTEFNAPNGWLERWKERHNITFKRQHGEKQDANDFGAERWVVEIFANNYERIHSQQHI